MFVFQRRGRLAYPLKCPFLLHCTLVTYKKIIVQPSWSRKDSVMYCKFTIKAKSCCCCCCFSFFHFETPALSGMRSHALSFKLDLGYYIESKTSRDERYSSLQYDWARLETRGSNLISWPWKKLRKCLFISSPER